MNNVICPSCGKPNSNKVEICQYCGAVLKRSATEPLAPIHPGDMPVKRKTSDLESTLPGWLRDARQASGEESATTQIHFPNTTPASSAKSLQPTDLPKPQSPRKQAASSPLDFLAGLSHVNDDEEETPDWLKGLQDSIPIDTEPLLEQPQQAQSLPQPEKPAQDHNSDWNFNAESDVFQFDNGLAPAQNTAEETPGWLAALQSQDQSANATLVSKPPASQPDPVPLGDLPDWLSALTGGISSQPPDPVLPQTQPAERQDAPDWLSGLGGDFTPEDTLASPESDTASDAQTPDWFTRMDEPKGIPVKTDPAADLPAWVGELSASVQTPSPPIPELLAPSSDSDLFDWFNTAQDAPSPQATQPKTIEPPVEDMPDWMRDLQTPTPHPAAPVAKLEAPAASADDIPDWMKDLQVPAPIAPKTPAAVPAPVEDMPDWMRDLQAPTSHPAAPVAKLETPAASADGIPDWMTGLQDFAPAAPTPPIQPAAVPTPVEDMPDWMRDLQASATLPDAPVAKFETPAASADGIPDWMTGLQDLAPAAPTAPAAVPTPVEDMPDWMRDLQASATLPDAPVAKFETPAAPVDGIPDWMTGLQDLAPAAPTAPAAVQAPVEDMPDWMRDLQASATLPDAPTVKFETPASPVDGIPDWMTGLQDLAPSAPAAPAAAPTPVEDMPDWMKDLQAPAPSAPTTPAAIPTPVEDMPEWMRNLQAPASFPATPAAQVETPIPSADDMPDWMKDLNASTPLSSAPSVSQSDSVFGEDSPSDPIEKIPAWMAGLGAPGDTLATVAPKTHEPAESNPSSQTASASFETKPAAANQGEPSFLRSPDEQNLDSIFAMDVPEWLTGFTPGDAEKTAAQSAENPEDASLLPAELPSWVQAMRPMESVMAGADDSQDDQEVENLGPLAGLRSVLPVQSGPVDAYKSKPYALKLLADETQLAQAVLLDNLLNSESTPQKVPKPVKLWSIRPLRWLIAALLLLAVLVPLGLGTQIFPIPVMPTDPSPEGAFITVANALSSGQPVLVVVDYQPGFAGELEMAAGPMIAQLSQKNVPLAFISTSPVGPYMADRLVKGYAGAYQLKTQYVNLGYLPGGAGGIKAFAEQPASTVGQDIILGNMWDTPALSGATVNASIRLSNFGAVIVLTDNPDIGRLWIEQAQPSLKPSPMLMVVSAQAEPMIRPYLLSGQINGLVAGMEGAVLYEKQVGGTVGTHGPRTHWDAFGMAMLVAELLILFGGIWGLVTGLRARRTATEQDEA